MPEQFGPAGFVRAAPSREENSSADVAQGKLVQPDQAETAAPDWETAGLGLFAAALAMDRRVACARKLLKKVAPAAPSAVQYFASAVRSGSY